MGAPAILSDQQDSGFIGKICQDFHTEANIVLQTVIPGNHPSLGATDRRHGLFRGITVRLIEKKGIHITTNKDWGLFRNAHFAFKFEIAAIWRVCTWSKSL